MLDNFLIRVITWRLSRFRRMRDTADRFSDRLIELLRTELERRNQLYAGWDRELTDRESKAAEDTIRARVVEEFEGLGRADRLNLQ